MYDLDKQPRWVQEEIASLERRLDTAQRTIAELESDSYVEYGGDMTWDKPVGIMLPIDNKIRTLPQGTTVYFKQHRGYMSLWQRGLNQNEVQVMTVNNRIVVRPEVSNSIAISMEEE